MYNTIIKKALDAGAKPEEIADAISPAVLMGGRPVATTSAKAFKALEELVKKNGKEARLAQSIFHCIWFTSFNSHLDKL